MTIAELCLPLMVILAIVSIGPAKLDGIKEFDNGYPRDPGFYRPGLRARALGAQQNGFEAFPFFAAAVIVAEMRGAAQGWVNALAVAFLAMRVVYVLMYIDDRPSLRSTVWGLAFACNLALFFAPIWAGR
ncbi:MAG TPA: MAPEG family protein [Rhodopila sp.]|nr:MAPEG family protein [Rhodopila sp.]